MKFLLLTFSVLMFAVACNNDSKSEFVKEKQEASQDYREDVNEAREDRNEAIGDAREDLQEEQREEAIDYVEDSESVDLRRDDHTINVEESKDQKR